MDDLISWRLTALSLVAWRLATRGVHRKVLNLEWGHSETSYVWISESFFSHFKVGDDLYVWVGRLLDERYAISFFLETMDANDFGSTNALKSLWLTPARFRAEKDWERYEWPMRGWKIHSMTLGAISTSLSFQICMDFSVSVTITHHQSDH